jgi:hypothetical protein
MNPHVWPQRATCPRPGCGREGERTGKAHTPDMVEVGS